MEKRVIAALPLAVLGALLWLAAPAMAFNPDTLVTVGSPTDEPRSRRTSRTSRRSRQTPTTRASSSRARTTRSTWRRATPTFSDKDQIWADNASSSPFFGNVYVCWASFVGQEKGNAAPAALQVAVSRDGGDTWSEHQISAAADNSQRNPEDGCTIRTDSQGNAYVFGIATSQPNGKQTFEMMSKSTNGGKSWSLFRPVAGPVTQPGVLDPVQGRPVIDGIAGARSDLAPAPSVANGSPSGSDATDRIVMTYVSGTLAAPHVFFTESTDHGNTWSAPRQIETAGDRGLYTAPSISPNGKDVYVVYNAYTTPFRDNTTDMRSLVGVVLHADSSTDASMPTGSFSSLNRSDGGDPRASSANALTDEFLGDYVYATATRSYGAAVWNSDRNAPTVPRSTRGGRACRTAIRPRRRRRRSRTARRRSATPTSSEGRTRTRRPDGHSQPPAPLSSHAAPGVATERALAPGAHSTSWAAAAGGSALRTGPESDAPRRVRGPRPESWLRARSPRPCWPRRGHRSR